MKLVKSTPNFRIKLKDETRFEMPTPSVFGATHLPPADSDLFDKN